MMCSGKLAGQLVLSLQLNLSNNGQTQEKVVLKMSKEKLYKMIGSLETANKVCT